MTRQTIVFIHGMFMNSSCWDGWGQYFTQAGYDVVAPSWPLHDQSVKELRSQHPNPALGKLGLNEVTGHFRSIIREMKTPPILIGHSMGGLVSQLLTQTEKVAAAVVLNSAPPLGVITLNWNFYRSNWPLINPLKHGQPYNMAFKDFQQTFANSLSLAEQTRLYEQYMVPESRQLAWDSLTSKARIDFGRAHAPLLFIAGEKDHIIPPSLNLANQRRYRDPGSVADFVRFADRAHISLCQEHWEEIAEYVRQWISRQVH